MNKPRRRSRDLHAVSTAERLGGPSNVVRVAPRARSATGGAAGSTTLKPVPSKSRRLPQAREHWAAADWKALSHVDQDALQAHPERCRVAIVVAAAALQSGDRQSAREHSFRAVQWGCDKRFLAAVMLASAHHTLGRASIAAGRTEQAARHFERGVFEPHMPSAVRRFARGRTDAAMADLALRRDGAARQRKAGLKVDDKANQAWLGDIVARCMSAPDLHEAVDRALAQLLSTADDRVCFLMCLAERLQAQRDAMTAVHYLSTATEIAHDAQADLRLALAKQLVATGHATQAMDLLFDNALASVSVQPSDEALIHAVRSAYQALRDAEQSRREHGHEVLLAYLKLHLNKLTAAASGRRLQMVEIGTTRENVPGQGSTRKLADFCRQHSIAFVTVDMDPHNAQMAEQTFKRLQVDFEARAMKGEDYLRERKTPVDIVFLDAYDFDHGKHSELRQSRYLKYLGSRIDEQACHQMHLDCAQSLLRLLSPGGIVCIDDTWLDKEQWTAKGTLAMPYLLASGFELVDARNRAALLQRNAATLAPKPAQ